MENIIKIHLNEKSDYQNKFNEEILSYDLSNYILEEVRSINTKEKIKFAIFTNFDMQDTEKDTFISMIRNKFGDDISEIINSHYKQRIANLLIFLIGLIFLTIYSLFEITVISEVILILAWVFIWEAICNFLYKEIESNFKIKKRKQIINAKVFFEK